MKRRLPVGSRPARLEQDIKKAYTQDQLHEVGAITLLWNQIEAGVDFLLFIVLSSSSLHHSIWLGMMKKIQSLDGKIEILRKQYEASDILNQKARNCIKSAFDAVSEYNTYRNGIVHSHVFDHEKGIAQYHDSGRNPWQILMTKEALTNFYKRLMLLRRELREIDLLYRIAEGEKRMIVVNDKTGLPEPDQPKALRDKAVPEQTGRVLHYQNMRQALPPLPKFPDEPVTPPEMEAVEMRPSQP